MKKINRPDLNIDDRMNKIKQEILELNPDIFCLQEADIYIYKKYLLKKDMEQYNILYGINCGSSFINIIAYKKEKFELKSFKNFSLLFLGKYSGNRGIMTVDLELINEANNNNINKEKDNTTINLKEKENNKINNNKNITIYNVHFPWKYENDRILLLNMLFKHIKENHNFEEKNNIFIVGDFNSEPPSRTIKLFYYNKIKNDKRNFYVKKFKNKKKCFDLQTLQLSEYIYNHFKFQSAYQCYSKEKMIKGDIMRHPLFTSRTKFYKRTIDYIFFSKNVQINKILKLPRYYNVDKEKFLPSKEYPSDHLKLFAEFSV
jgi:mRNA deadenylase 3'-5' endonuclease subunit Ccr4